MVREHGFLDGVVNGLVPLALKDIVTQFCMCLDNLEFLISQLRRLFEEAFRQTRVA